MDQKSVIQEAIDATYHELEEAGKPKERSRIAKSTNGYIHLTSWSNAQLLRVFVRLFTPALPRSEFRLKTQLNDAARSVIANIEEGYRRPTTMEYITFLGYSQASLTEVKGDIQRSLQDGFLKSIPGSSLSTVGINLTDWHEMIKQSVISKPIKLKGNYRNLEESKEIQSTNNYTHVAQPTHAIQDVHTAQSAQTVQKNTYSMQTANTIQDTSILQPTNTTQDAHVIIQTPLNSFKFLYPPVDDLKAQQLTYEVFIELINKTDWNLRKLVASLEDKLARDQQFYQVERSRIRGNTNWNR